MSPHCHVLRGTNAAHSLLERTLDDSGNRRTLLPEAFLATSEILRRVTRLVSGFTVNQATVLRNMSWYGPFAATERVLMEAVRHGGDRQQLHEQIRQHSLAVWGEVQSGQPNTLAQRIRDDEIITQYLRPDAIDALMDATQYVGDAPQRAKALARRIRVELAADDDSTDHA